MAGKQEWVTDIKYINITGKAIAFILIFKDEYINIQQINKKIPGN